MRKKRVAVIPILGKSPRTFGFLNDWKNDFGETETNGNLNHNEKKKKRKQFAAGIDGKSETKIKEEKPQVLRGLTATKNWQSSNQNRNHRTKKWTPTQKGSIFARKRYKLINN